MAYSRWSNSVWYTYWTNTCEEPTLSVCRVGGEFHNVPYFAMEDDVAAAAERCRGPNDTDEEITELEGYMKEFMEDVELKASAPKEKHAS